jgi:hypothetical protein
MANSTNINNPETTTNAQIQGAGLVLPAAVNERDPNKLSVLFTPNSSVLYSKYSPYPQGESGGIIGANQPYIVTNINDANKGINSTLKWAPLQPSAVIDVVRVTKYSASNPGIKFLLKQIYLQGYQPFNETKLYNPLMPIQATLRVASFGILDRPLRHIEPNLGGVLGILGLKGIAGAFGFNPPNPPPRGTAPGVGGTPLSIINPGDGKGLTRGATATSAYSGQNYKYLSSPSKTGLLKNIGNFFKSSTLFGTFFAIGQPAGTIYKGDDQTYNLMINNKRIVSFDKRGVNTYDTLGAVQRFSTDNRDLEGTPTYDKYSRYVGQYNSAISKYSAESFSIDINSKKIGDGFSFIGAANKTYFAGINVLNPGFEVSDILFLFTDYLLNSNYPTKFQDSSISSQTTLANDQLQKLELILKSNYTFEPPTKLQDLQDQGQIPYIRTYKNYKNGKDLLDGPDGKGFAGVNQSDLINVLNVQSNTDAFIDKDLIKFYFYDVYNKKYIPFRATVKGISERSVSSWDDFQYIGNADKVYNYKGFTRGLGFSFTVVAMSVKELLPMWQRINYLMGLTKPANYKNGFIVPPLVMMTIGDIYKNQPIVINSINMTIPDNATWETVSDSTDTYEYLNGRLRSNIDMTLAQFPREADISIDANILEKEKPQTGLNNFGDVNIGNPFANRLSVLFSEKEIQQIRQSGALELFEQRRDELQNLA